MLTSTPVLSVLSETVANAIRESGKSPAQIRHWKCVSVTTVCGDRVVSSPSQIEKIKWRGAIIVSAVSCFVLFVFWMCLASGTLWVQEKPSTLDYTKSHERFGRRLIALAQHGNKD